MTHCPHTRVWKEVTPFMGRRPLTWKCEDCGTTVPITWVPVPWQERGELNGYRSTQDKDGNPVWEKEEKAKCSTWCRKGCPKIPCPCSCHKDPNEIINEGLDMLYPKKEHWGFNKQEIKDREGELRKWIGKELIQLRTDFDRQIQYLHERTQ